MKNKLYADMERIISSYQMILDNWSNFDAFQGDLNRCQSELNLLSFSPDDYLDEEVRHLLLKLKEMHHVIFQKSLKLLSDTEKKYDTVVSSKNKILKYTSE